jgi:NAD(P)-dependent dehydrogenase (short-subunit alcohol dehydrogenase family)
MNLEGKRVLIVGGSSGIGLAVARLAMSEGAHVIIGSSNAERVMTAVAGLQDGEGVVVNVRDQTSVDEAAEAIGPFDHLVFTAGDWGGVRGRSLADVDLDQARGAMDVRFWGALRVIKTTMTQIRAGGSVTLTDGLLGHRPQKGSFLSTASAGAIEHLVRGLAVEMAPIRVNGVCPGVVLTEIWKGSPPERLAAMTSRLPLPRGGEPAEVAEAYVHLMRAGYTTGQILHVDGGGTVV